MISEASPGRSDAGIVLNITTKARAPSASFSSMARICQSDIAGMDEDDEEDDDEDEDEAALVIDIDLPCRGRSAGGEFRDRGDVDVDVATLIGLKHRASRKNAMQPFD